MHRAEVVLDMSEVNSRLAEPETQTPESVALDIGEETEICRVDLEPEEAAVLIQPMTEDSSSYRVDDRQIFRIINENGQRIYTDMKNRAYRFVAVQGILEDANGIYIVTGVTTGDK
ncbi:hypothetical protein TSAR_000849 [Trichomalopsis sarcophagae]|uniref:Uncharacterized protein n=1 Tax=Trichomalopsis sarcophagae TaxID=543379 RepID=A0A232FGK4_9HYME|nr:hypothetical protein TSAR_000849 [Trichomalopsis sarcophagae]